MLAWWRWVWLEVRIRRAIAQERYEDAYWLRLEELHRRVPDARRDPLDE